MCDVTSEFPSHRSTPTPPCREVGLLTACSVLGAQCLWIRHSFGKPQDSGGA